MATALIGGLLQQGYRPGDLRVVELSEEARARLRQQFGVSAVAAIDQEIPEDAVLLAVKPQQMRAAAKALRVSLKGQLVISIAAGIRTADLSRWLGGHERIVRVMPNTPALIRSGVSGMYAGAAINQTDRDADDQLAFKAHAQRLRHRAHMLRFHRQQHGVLGDFLVDRGNGTDAELLPQTCTRFFRDLHDAQVAGLEALLQQTAD